MSRTRRLLAVLGLNLALVAGLVVVGVTAHSLSVLAEGGDYLLDAAAVGVALAAVRLSRPAGAAGLPARPNAANIAALINGGWLLALELLVMAASADRLIAGAPAVDGLPVLVVSAVAALVMTAAALVLRADEGDGAERDLSVAAVLLDTVGDAAAAAGVAATGGVIWAAGGWYWLDPAVALVIAVIIAYHALALIRKARGRMGAASTGGAG